MLFSRFLLNVTRGLVTPQRRSGEKSDTPALPNKHPIPKPHMSVDSHHNTSTSLLASFLVPVSCVLLRSKDCVFSAVSAPAPDHGEHRLSVCLNG